MASIISLFFFSFTWIIPVILIMCFAKRLTELPIIPRFLTFFAMAFLGSVVGLFGGQYIFEALVSNGYIGP